MRRCNIRYLYTMTTGFAVLSIDGQLLGIIPVLGLSDIEGITVNENRQLTGMFVLRAGWHGLRKTIPQAEGIAMTPDGTLFLVSEPNLFYRFKTSGR